MAFRLRSRLLRSPTFRANGVGCVQFRRFELIDRDAGIARLDTSSYRPVAIESRAGTADAAHSRSAVARCRVAAIRDDVLLAACGPLPFAAVRSRAAGVASAVRDPFGLAASRGVEYLA